ncbi:efflux RND transporter permease subunit [Sulfurimonas microaerophilic]|uniref:efflux RND transporter permease subunit n=1 Tax=Sulfurimonas microaerophilic TaxID=3058392 RepID=UPI0027155CCA|nr:CusA/CzcA family heavy metal efflux RND transporter [Sulfurimonas sp. hsl 1-7]
MIEKIIDFSIKNKFLILFATLFLVIGSIWSMRNTPLDALPDLSPPQVIVQVKYNGQSPQTIEEQGTYPLVSEFLSIANIETVRGYSTYENALIYIIFKEDTDLYWARSRVLEQLATVQSKLPKNMSVTLGPDASGVGWVYEYALSSKTKNLSELRTLQDYYYKYALMGVDGVSEVASIGGFVPTYEVSVTNDTLVKYNLSINEIAQVLQKNNNDTGGRIVIKNGYEWMVQAKGYLKNLDDIKKLTVALKDGVPLTLGDIADVRLVPAARRGMADLDGQGEVVGGIVLVRYGEDVYKVLQNIKVKMKELKIDGVDVTTVYDRSELIDGALGTLKDTLIEESIIVIVVIGLFLLHFRSALIVLFIVPLTVGVTFLLMKFFGVGSNIMSLGGIAIAIGAMVDASIVMIENAHKMLNKFYVQHSREPDYKERFEIVLQSSQRVGRPIFFALTLIVVSFLPIFALSNQEGLLFTPLAFTKTFAMSAGAMLSITLVPVLILLFVKGKIMDETRNPINRFFIVIYHPILTYALKLRYILILFLLVSLGSIYPLYNALKWEFMPMLNEQTFMYMPVTPYGISIDQSKALTQKTDAIIKSFPEVEHVFGKGGRANSATDPAPLGMVESIITFKPKSQWREGVTYESLKEDMERALDIPGLTNSWTYPIRGRIDMLLSGIRTPIGIKLYGKDAKGLQKYAKEIEEKLRTYDKTLSVLADQAGTGYYLYVDLNEDKLQRYGLTKAQVLQYISFGVGGLKLSMLYKGLERYPIALRLEDRDRDTLASVKNIQIKTKLGFVPLGSLADVYYKENQSVIKSELAKPVTFIYITPQEGVSVKEYVSGAKKMLESVKLEDGYYIEFAGQSQYLDRAMEKIIWIIPLVLLVIMVLIYLALRKIIPTLIVFFSLPFALLGGLLYIYMLDFSMSIAVIVGFLALLGVAAETAIVMIVYLQEAVSGAKDIRAAIYEGAVQRVRPKLMTTFSILAGLAPIMYTNGIGSEVMQRIAAPMLGGIVSSAILSLVIIPILYEIYAKWEMKR